MIEVLLKSTVVILAATGATMVLKRQSAATRHLVWSVGLMAALAVPLATWLMPVWELPFDGPLPALLGDVDTAQLGPDDIVPLEGGTSAIGEAGRNWAQLALRIWIAGAAVGLLIMLIGTARLGRIAFRAQPFGNRRWRALSDEIAGRLRLRRPVRLLQNTVSSLLGTWGIMTHHVLLPEGAETWSEERIRMVLAHELAHARRRDWLFQVFAEAARAIYWFNPLFWLAAERIRAESEQASDDAVLRLGTEGSDYAQELIHLTRSLRDQRPESLPVLGMTHTWHMERRILAVLNPSLKRFAATPWAVVLVVIGAIGLTLPLAAVRTAPPANPAGAALSTDTTGTGETDVFGAPELRESDEPDPSPQPRLSEVDAEIDLPSEPCPATPTTWEAPPESDGGTALLGPGPWYVNEDRTIWVWHQPWSADDVINTVWVRPPGQRLVLTGRLLFEDDVSDEEAGLGSSITPTGALGFKTSALLFSAPGCWEVTASAGDAELVFVTEVEP